MVGGDGVGGECAVSVELLWNRLSGFISPSHLYLRRNVASSLKPISITFLHFINFRTITWELPFDSCSSSLSCTSKRSLREQGCETSLILYSVFPLIAKLSAFALSSLVPKVCSVCPSHIWDVRALSHPSLRSALASSVQLKLYFITYRSLISCTEKFHSNTSKNLLRGSKRVSQPSLTCR